MLLIAHKFAIDKTKMYLWSIERVTQRERKCSTWNIKHWKQVFWHFEHDEFCDRKAVE